MPRISCVSPVDTDTPLHYSPIEVRSYLPSGWNLEEAEGSYDERKRRWRIRVQDVSELDSHLTVEAKSVEKLGRIPALRAAIDRLVRKL